MPSSFQPTAPALGQIALWYAVELGWAVFPLHYPREWGCSCGAAECESIGKHPQTKAGCLDASSHPEAVGLWWDRSPLSNVAIATGPGSGIAVVDVDGPAGEEALATCGPMPPTVTSLTGKGRHLIFRYPDLGLRNSSEKLGPKLDVRGCNGYIVAPPSLHASGRRYAWAPGLSPFDIALAPFPDRLLQRLAALGTEYNAPASPTPAPQSESPTLRLVVQRTRSVRDAVTEVDRRVCAYLATVGPRSVGGRNSAAFQIAAWLLRDFGLPERAAYAYLEEWNGSNRPPLGQRELRAVFASAGSHAQRPTGWAHRKGSAA